MIPLDPFTLTYSIFPVFQSVNKSAFPWWLIWQLFRNKTDTDVEGISEQLLVRLTKQNRHRDMYSPIRRNTRNNRRSSEIQGTALGKCLQAWPVLYIYIYRSMPAGVAQSSHAFVGGTVSTWARWRIPVNKGRKGIRNADQALTVLGELAGRIVGSPIW